MNEVKKRLAMAGYSVAAYDANSLDALEDFKNTSKYKKWKEERENKRKAIINKMKRESKVDYEKAFKMAYNDYTPSYNKYKVVDKPRVRL